LKYVRTHLGDLGVGLLEAGEERAQRGVVVVLFEEEAGHVRLAGLGGGAQPEAGHETHERQESHSSAWVLFLLSLSRIEQSKEQSSLFVGLISD